LNTHFYVINKNFILKKIIMKKFFLSSVVIAFLFATLPAHAKIWRINNNPGVTADFTSLTLATASASVINGDTIYLESSTTEYAAGTLTKRLVIVGLGYFLNPANATTPGNAGLQAATVESRLGYITIENGANGSKFLGIASGGAQINVSATSYNLVFEKVNFTGGLNFSNATHSNITIRKSFFNNTGVQAATGNLSNFVVENCIFYNFSGYMSLQALTGTANIIRNNTFFATYFSNIPNCYFANNIIADPNYEWVFTNTTVKNNLFARASQVLPLTATANQLGVNMTNVFLLTGSFDARYQLKPLSPAIGAGLTVGAVVTPDCGAFGATDPYKLSGIPNIPSIYALTVPISIPSGTATMNVTFSTRNTN
jgi:hypothetical protein